MNSKLNKSQLNGASNTLRRSLRSILRPIVKLMIQNNIPLKGFIEEIKLLYVDVAQESLNKESVKAILEYINSPMATNTPASALYWKKIAPSDLK